MSPELKEVIARAHNYGQMEYDVAVEVIDETTGLVGLYDNDDYASLEEAGDEVTTVFVREEEDYKDHLMISVLHEGDPEDHRVYLNASGRALFALMWG